MTNNTREIKEVDLNREDNIFVLIKEFKMALILAKTFEESDFKGIEETITVIEELAIDEYKDYGFVSSSGLLESLKKEVKQGYENKDFEEKIKNCISLLEEA